MGEKQGPGPLPGRPSHSCCSGALDKRIGMKDFGAVGFPWMDDNRF